MRQETKVFLVLSILCMLAFVIFINLYDPICGTLKTEIDCRIADVIIVGDAVCFKENEICDGNYAPAIIYLFLMMLFYAIFCVFHLREGKR